MIKAEYLAHEANHLGHQSDSEDLKRAQYVLVEPNHIIKPQVQIYSKMGSSSRYRECIQQKPSKPVTEQKIRKIISKKRKSSSDDDYSVKNQKKDRNVTSNLIHHLVKYLMMVNKEECRIRKIIESKRLRILYQQFQVQLEKICKTLKTYVTLNHIQKLWFSELPQNAEFCLIMRILSKVFFTVNGFSSVYYSNKFNLASKTVHYKGIRNLLQVLTCRDLDQLQNSLHS